MGNFTITVKEARHTGPRKKKMVRKKRAQLYHEVLTPEERNRAAFSRAGIYHGAKAAPRKKTLFGAFMEAGRSTAGDIDRHAQSRGYSNKFLGGKSKFKRKRDESNRGFGYSYYGVGR